MKTRNEHPPSPTLAKEILTRIALHTESIEDIAYTYKAVNSHGELLQVVKDLRYRSFDPSFKGWDFKKLDRVIAKAEGGE